MSEININIEEFQRKRVLITVLNWGLGHATRSIPIIRMLSHSKIEVAIASDGEALSLLIDEFPEITSFELPAYNIHYPYKSMELNMILQAPRFTRAINKERRKIKEIIAEWNADVIISDNRFGCRSDKCHSIFMTHQVNLITSNTLSRVIGNILNRRMILKFDELWIPDYSGVNSVAGKLSDTSHLRGKIKTRFINPISRFELGEKNQKSKRDILLLLSGPEPARSNLEDVLLRLLDNLDLDIMLVRGTMTKKPLSINMPYKSILNAEELNNEILQSKLIICRSGYTSIMDLIKLNKKAILIPTPGQTEQVYLAEYHKNKEIFEIWESFEDSKLLIEKIEKIIGQKSNIDL